MKGSEQVVDASTIHRCPPLCCALIPKNSCPRDPCDRGLCPLAQNLLHIRTILPSPPNGPGLYLALASHLPNLRLLAPDLSWPDLPSHHPFAHFPYPLQIIPCLTIPIILVQIPAPLLPSSAPPSPVLAHPSSDRSRLLSAPRPVFRCSLFFSCKLPGTRAFVDFRDLEEKETV